MWVQYMFHQQMVYNPAFHYPINHVFMEQWSIIYGAMKRALARQRFENQKGATPAPCHIHGHFRNINWMYLPL